MYECYYCQLFVYILCVCMYVCMYVCRLCRLGSSISAETRPLPTSARPRPCWPTWPLSTPATTVCMYVCMYANVCMYTYVCMRMHVCQCMYVCQQDFACTCFQWLYVCMYVLYAWIYMCMYCMYVCMYVCICIGPEGLKNIASHIHILAVATANILARFLYIHTYIHTFT